MMVRPVARIVITRVVVSTLRIRRTLEWGVRLTGRSERADTLRLIPERSM